MMINGGRRVQRKHQTRRAGLSVKLKPPDKPLALPLVDWAGREHPARLIKGDHETRDRLGQRKGARIKRRFAFNDDAGMGLVSAKAHIRNVRRQRRSGGQRQGASYKTR
jgi:hypothetical protein